MAIAKNFNRSRGDRRTGRLSVLVRPSFVLGGRAMEIVYNQEGLGVYLRESAGKVTSEHPVLIDRYIEDAFEFDVDAVSDGEETIICG